MKRFVPIFILVLAGCASQPDPETLTNLAIQRAEHQYQETKLRDSYRRGFTYGFIQMQKGHGGPLDIFGSDDPDRAGAYLMGYDDGQFAVLKMRDEQESQQAKEKQR